MGDALDFIARVDTGIDRTVTVPGFGLAEIQPAGQLAHDQDIEPALHQVGAQGTGRRQRGVQAARPEVREQAELLTQRQQSAALRAQVGVGDWSYFGPPTDPNKTASLCRARASVSGGSG